MEVEVEPGLSRLRRYSAVLSGYPHVKKRPGNEEGGHLISAAL